jgi:hypothetical protein
MRGLVPPASGAAAAIGARLGFVDRQAAALDLLAVQRRDGGLGLLVAAHLHKAEPLGATRVATQLDCGSALAIIVVTCLVRAGGRPDDGAGSRSP